MNTCPRILCVDDEPLNQMVLEGVLVPKGYEVITAAEGRQADDMIDKPQLVIVGMRRRRPVIAMTALAMKGMRSGACGQGSTTISAGR
jgi:DNA-binding NtrC family response regulator